MSTTTIERTVPVARNSRAHDAIPLSRIVGVEVSKMFNTRSGYWLLASVGILSTLATVATVLFAPDDQISYDGFAAAVGFPMSVVLPMIAILSVTSEWSQRSGLTTFTLVPHRGRVIAAKLLATLLVGAASIGIAFGVGALGNVVGSAIAGVGTTWDITLGEAALIFLADALGMLMGFTLGILIRSSPGAIVGYFVYALVLPAALGTLAAFQDWFADRQGWVDFNFASTRLYEGDLAGKDWAHLAVSGTFWLAIPLAIGLFVVTRSEVK
ncbi:MAG: ABC transporter permease [Propionibacteriales bacterium]|nr:ABC transporter permease [Propionibacteriales bacterium]